MFHHDLFNTQIRLLWLLWHKNSSVKFKRKNRDIWFQVRYNSRHLILTQMCSQQQYSKAWCLSSNRQRAFTGTGYIHGCLSSQFALILGHMNRHAGQKDRMKCERQQFSPKNLSVIQRYWRVLDILLYFTDSVFFVLLKVISSLHVLSSSPQLCLRGCSDQQY